MQIQGNGRGDRPQTDRGASRAGAQSRYLRVSSAFWCPAGTRPIDWAGLPTITSMPWAAAVLSAASSAAGSGPCCTGGAWSVPGSRSSGDSRCGWPKRLRGRSRATALIAAPSCAAAAWPRSCLASTRSVPPLPRRAAWPSGLTTPRSRRFESPRSTSSMAFTTSFAGCRALPFLTMSPIRRVNTGNQKSGPRTSRA